MKSSNSPKPISEPFDIAHGDVMNTRNWFASTISGLALIASIVSLWESTLKQPQIDLYVSENVQYTRDPYGPFEVLAVSITIANSGARDGTVLSLQLQAKTPGSDKVERFNSAYLADAQYFGSRDDVAARMKRPKVPFAPISVSGRNAFSGTVLFYRAYSNESALIQPSSKLEFSIVATMPPAKGWLDNAVSSLPAPVTVKADVPNFYPGGLISGDNATLKVTSGAL
ncbi:MAG: hypothetical protein QM780_06660 [Hyphomicrobium sp.]|uniref:hypothetical protein n=1 Tax=Hyphomicrobium sp. TaxID=82 RepID=UPI0039E33E4C